MIKAFQRILIGFSSAVFIPLGTAFFAAAALLLAPFDPGGRRTHVLVTRNWGRFVLFVSGLKAEVRGLDRMGEGPYIVATNHQSHLDIPLLFSVLPLQLRFIAKKELLFIPLFGQAMARAGHIPIDRGRREAALAGLRKASALMRENRVSVTVAPEGTRSPDGNLLPFKKGAFMLALESHLPILPVVVEGTGRAMPKGGFLPRGGRAVVTVGDPIPTEGMDFTRREELMKRVREWMEKTLAGLRNPSL